MRDVLTTETVAEDRDLKFKVNKLKISVHHQAFNDQYWMMDSVLRGGTGWSLPSLAGWARWSGEASALSTQGSCMSELAHFNNCGKYLSTQLKVFFPFVHKRL